MLSNFGDSPTPWTIGVAYTLVNAEPEVEEIIQAIRQGATAPLGKAIPWAMRLQKAFLSYKKKGKVSAQSFQAEP